MIEVWKNLGARALEEFSQDRQVFSGSFRRPEVPLSFEITRELNASDLYVRSTLGADSVTPRIKSLRATHHKLAQCLAMNFSNAEASISTGYSPSRISILMGDPSFQELLAFYKDKKRDVFVDVQQRMAGFATDAVEVLQERLAESPEKFTNKDLNELIKTTADRGGHSPVNRSETKNINLTAADLDKMKQEVEEAQNGTVRRINQGEESQRVKTVLASEAGPQSSEGQGAQISCNDNRPASVVHAETSDAGSKGEGDNV